MLADTSNDTKANTGYNERVYSTSEVAKMIGIAVPTVRKYSQSLESKNYEFSRSKEKGRQKARLYYHNDIMSLRYLKETREQANITVEEATNITVEKFGKGVNEAILTVRGTDTQVINNDLQQYSNQYDELKDMIQKLEDKTDKQNELILNLTEKIEQQEKYISEQLPAPIEQKEIETPKEIKTLENNKEYPQEKTSEIEEASTEEISAKGIEAYSEIETHKEFDVLFKGGSESVEKPKENESSKLVEAKLSTESKEIEVATKTIGEALTEETSAKETEEAPKEKGQSFFSKLLDKLIIDTRDNK